MAKQSNLTIGTSPMTFAEMEKMVEDWASSSDATAELQATKELAKAAAEKVAADAQVDAEQLRQAVTL